MSHVLICGTCSAEPALSPLYHCENCNSLIERMAKEAGSGRFANDCKSEASDSLVQETRERNEFLLRWPFHVAGPRAR